MQLLSEETLAHYGIPGMKKGERRWQYKDGRFNPEGKERYFGKKSEKRVFDINRDRLDPDTLKNISEISEEAFYLHTNKKFKKNTEIIDKRRSKEVLDKDTGLYLKNNKTSIEDDVSKVNPFYNTNHPGYYNNCSFCSLTYIERRAGYDAVANFLDKGINTGDTKKISEMIFSKNNIKDSYYNKNYYDINTYKESINKAEYILNKLEEGQASIISIYNAKTYSGGHYLNAEKRNGKILIIDSQDNKIYSFEKFKKEFNNWPIAGVTNIDYNNLEFKNINAINDISHNEYKEDKAMKLLSEDILSHYGIPGMKHGVRRWQYEDGRFTPEGKERYFGSKSPYIEKLIKNFKKRGQIFNERMKINEKISEDIDIINKLLLDKAKELNNINFGSKEKIIEKGKSIMDLIFKSNKSINKRIEKSLNKEIQQLLANKNKYTSQEFNTKLNELVFQKNVYNNNLKEYKKQTWWSNFSNSFKQKTSDMAAEKIGRGVIEFLLG